MTKPTSRSPAPTPPSLHQRRAHRLLVIASAIAAVHSLAWGAVFAVRGEWLAVTLDVVKIVLAGSAAALGHAGRIRDASRLLIGVLFFVLCFQAGVMDVPSAEVPRFMHQHLLALGVVSVLLTQDEPAWLRHGIPWMCFAAYVGFASTNAAPHTEFALPDSIRVHGAWVNLAVSMGILAVALHVIQSDMLGHNEMERQIRAGILSGEFSLHYQPQLDENDRVIGAEALLRWKQAKRGMVSPAEFIPIAEQTGLMMPLGDWVMKTACQQLAVWGRRPETADLVLAVNVSASQFATSGFVARVQSLLAETGADPARLKIELTESMLANDLEDIIGKMAALREHGVSFSLDDFGTGFSSLSYLRRLPLDQLKIDQSFTRDVLSSDNGAGIAKAVVALGLALRLEVIAEGVETVGQRDFLAGIGCTLYQGYLFSKPLPVGDFDAFVEKNARAAAEPPAATGAGFAQTRQAKLRAV